MANNERIRKVSEQIRRELVDILPESVFHPKITFVSVTGMDLSRDFKWATVHITLIGSDATARQEMVDLLNQYAPRMRSLLAKRLSTRTVPSLKFAYDVSVEYGARMDLLLTSLTKDIPPEDPISKDSDNTDSANKGSHKEGKSAGDSD